jgi:hypothetical protein
MAEGSSSRSIDCGSTALGWRLGAPLGGAYSLCHTVCMCADLQVLSQCYFYDTIHGVWMETAAATGTAPDGKEKVLLQLE